MTSLPAPARPREAKKVPATSEMQAYRILHASRASLVSPLERPSLLRRSKRPRSIFGLLTFGALVLLTASATVAQDAEPAPEHHHHEAPAAADDTWMWTGDANVFFGYNYQQRKYADFSSWESQNWFMLAGSRKTGAGTLGVMGMLSLEPFTIPKEGSPQLFQTGESYQMVPLVNLQHPHDLLMGLGATYRIERPRLTYVFEADVVGSPALGPTAFMHRESARDNPQVPLTHHSIDSTHITPGVIRVGVEAGAMSYEGSVFRGEEPDENRLNIDALRLNSWSARLGWHHGPWKAQVSGGRLHEPEWFEPYMVTRLTASFEFNGAVGRMPLSATGAWGQNRENNGFDNRDDSYLLEWTLRPWQHWSTYGRAEHSMKQIFGLGFHPKGFTHPHFYSRINAVTIGAVRDLPIGNLRRFGIGGDVTAYRTTPELTELYDGSHAFHVFLRWRPGNASMSHMH